MSKRKRPILRAVPSPNVTPAQARAAAAPFGGGVVRKTKRGPITPEMVRDEPELVLAQVAGKMPTLDEVLPGPANAAARQQILATGVWNNGKTRVQVLTRPREDGKHTVLSMMGENAHRTIQTAAISRNPGLTSDLIDAFDDFQVSGARDKASDVSRFWTIYDVDGVVNPSVNKIAALMASGGQFKVKRAKRGKEQKAREKLQFILDEVNNNVNNSPDEGAVTGARGLKMLTQQAVRQLLVEGDWFGRTIWTNHEVPGLGSFSLPMEIQSITSATMEPISEIVAAGREAWYWRPSAELINQLDKPKDPIIKKLLKDFVDSKILNELRKNRKVLLDPALIMHIKHRGVYHQPFGTSFIQPALFAIAFKRMIENLDFVMASSLVNRLTIVKVGNSDPQSPYSDPAVAQQRQALMQSFFEDPGPNMTIIWQGDDVDVVDVGAHSKILDLTGRHEIGDKMKKTALGVPDALLTGSSTDGKSSAFAAMLSAGSSLDETQSSFEQVYSTLGQRIATENNFTDVEIIYEFDNAMMLDRQEERNVNRHDFLTGAMSIRTFIAATGRDPDAEFRQVCFEKGLEPETTFWKDAFAPPTGLPGQGDPADGVPPGPPGQQKRNPGGGRTPDKVVGDPSKPPVEKKKPEEDK